MVIAGHPAVPSLAIPLLPCLARCLLLVVGGAKYRNDSPGDCGWWCYYLETG